MVMVSGTRSSSTTSTSATQPSGVGCIAETASGAVPSNSPNCRAAPRMACATGTRGGRSVFSGVRVGGVSGSVLVMVLRCQVLWVRGVRIPKATPGPQGGGRHRWVVERTVSWLSGCRRLHRRCERKPEHFLAFTAIAAPRMCHRRLAK